MRAGFGAPNFVAKQLMQLEGKTILITGGSSGIGRQLAAELLARRNKVIICGRSADKLNNTKQALPQVITFQCDLAREEQRRELLAWIKQEHQELSVLINNAAVANSGKFTSFDRASEVAKQEVEINLLAPIYLIEELLPVIQDKKESAIINVTTGLVYAPRAEYSFYNATKAALHSFTQTLRLQQAESSTKIIEILMPVVDTPWHKGSAPQSAISPEQAVQQMLAGLEKGRKEIRVGLVRLLYIIARIAPKLAIRLINN